MDPWKGIDFCFKYSIFTFVSVLGDTGTWPSIWTWKLKLFQTTVQWVKAQYYVLCEVDYVYSNWPSVPFQKLSYWHTWSAYSAFYRSTSFFSNTYYAPTLQDSEEVQYVFMTKRPSTKLNFLSLGAPFSR